ncbi:hypothetical protein INT47_006012 [Mucor saturninus]|uniref:Cas12f1-like TNB domain-containing protein n=1 Tax=Mucor saturninus TaxID=64648 RepID=A0A8H7QEQ8_9FUNG|nr:hypothetical protein INT47_006012 [Mucor saturninus]
MFINSLYTDGYTCRISFCRKRYAESPVNETALELQDFNSEEIDRYFRPCTVDPNRKDAFVSFHGNTDIRRLSSAEYYNMNGSANRLKLEQDRKKEQGVQTIETNIPSVKSAVADKYITHVKYMMQHQDTLFNFYNFQTARVKWCNYIGKQRALQDAVNILINGSKKYNKGRRKKTRKNKRKRSKTAAKYQSNTPQASSRRGKRASRNHKEKFEEGDKSKMPLIIFGDGLKNKSRVKISGLRHGVSEMIYKQLKLREKLGELLLLDIDEYKTSKNCNNCLESSLENLKHKSGTDNRSIHQIFFCKKCNIRWNRDVMATKNIYTIATSIWRGDGRPDVFKRQSATSNVVATPSPAMA